MNRIENGNAWLLYSSDAWHTHSSKALIGVFTDSDRFSDYIGDMRSSGKISGENAEYLLLHNQTQGLEENYIVEEEELNPLYSK